MLSRYCDSLKTAMAELLRDQEIKDRGESLFITYCCTQTANKYISEHTIRVLVFWNTSPSTCFWRTDMGVWKVKLFSNFIWLYFSVNKKHPRLLALEKHHWSWRWNCKSCHEWEFLFHERDWVGALFWQGTRQDHERIGEKGTPKTQIGTE